jgi:hypothetical protein
MNIDRAYISREQLVLALLELESIDEKAFHDVLEIIMKLPVKNRCDYI